MLPDFEARLRDYAAVIVRVGVNLQPGQKLLVTDPYDQQGVARSAEVLVDAVRRAALEVGDDFEVVWSPSAELRAMAEADQRGAFDRLVAQNTSRLTHHLRRGGAFLFLTGSQPRLMDGVPAAHLAAQHEIAWRHFGPIVQQLVRGASQWCIAPAPSPSWAALTFADLPSEQRLAALWRGVFDSVRADGTGDAVTRWNAHLDRLVATAERLNAARHSTVRLVGPGTDLTLGLPEKHHWCTAAQHTKHAVRHVINLPTEEIFTAPDCRRATGRVRVARPVCHAGTAIEGIELEFRSGRVVEAAARTNADLLRELLATDGGAARLGEVALLASELGAPAPSWPAARAVFHHPLLDENAANHVALGEAYPFCHRGWWKRPVNRSLVHVDLPLDARATLG
ncbi:aminopeptidase [Oleiharenicola sp. Vm1]|uniref:aminopeptidase n=1 Tax=Oleiharenicola sp. Vm1 TaxID=3398393 RepID=UPI0039F5EEE4